MSCTQILIPLALTQTIQLIDRHIDEQYKQAVNKAVRAESMRLLKQNDGAPTVRMKPLQKRVLITKLVADTHARLSRSGVFERSFIATGTWLPPDPSAGSQVALQGVSMKYDDHITPEKVTDHRRKVEEAELEEAAIRRAAIRKTEERAAAIANMLSPAVQKSLQV